MPTDPAESLNVVAQIGPAGCNPLPKTYVREDTERFADWCTDQIRKPPDGLPPHFTGIIKCAYGVPANMTYGAFVFVAVVG